MCKCRRTTRLGVIPLGLAVGLVSGLWLMIFSWATYNWGHGTALITQWGQIYPGYAATVEGGLYGLLWGFIDGFITGVVLAAIYNLFLWCCKSCCGCGSAYEELDEDEAEIKRIRRKRL